MSFRKWVPTFHARITFLSILMLSSLLIRLCDLKALEVGPLVEDLAMFVKFRWLKQPCSTIKAWLSASDRLIVAASIFPLSFRILHATNEDISYPFGFVVLPYVACTRQVRQCSPELFE